MNQQNPLETQLRHWIPRPPSARIEERLFGTMAPTPRRPQPTEAWTWLAPVTGLALLVFVVTHPADWVSLSSQRESTANRMQNRSETIHLAQMDATVFHTLHNHVGAIFESTNTRASALSLSSFLLLDTNGMKW